MSREKIATTDKGAQLIPCPGCGFVVRSHPELEELSSDRNWTRTCGICERKLCIVCFPRNSTTCVLDDCQLIGDALKRDRQKLDLVTTAIAPVADDGLPIGDFECYEDGEP